MAKISPIPSATFFSDPSQWLYHQLTASPSSITIGTDRVLQTPHSLGLTAKDVRRPDAWQFAAPPNPLRDPRHPDFTRFRPDSLVLPDDASVADALTTVHEQYEKVKDRADSPGLWTSEQASWKKFTMQRGTTGFWFVQKQSGGDLESAIPPKIRDIVIQIATTYAVNASVTDESRPDPADTNPGWPTFTAHPLGKLCSNVLVEPRFEGLLDNATTLARRLHLDEPTVLANGLGGRSGPLYKDTPLLRFNGSGWETYGTWKGLSQRNRVVQMSAAASNWMLKPLFNVLHGARSRIPGLWRTGNQDFELANRYKHRYESDISGFDISVTRQLQVLVSWALASVMPHLRQDLSSWLFVETLGLITPHWGMQFGLATLERFKGGTRSGVKTTAEAGQFYSLIATLYALHLHGFNVSEWPHSGHFTVVVQGDDVIVSTDRPLDPTTWAKAYATIGLKAELIEGDMFLSRHMSTERSSAPVAGRIVQQTLSNEHEPIGDMEDTVGILALGFIARAEGAERLPEDLQRMAAKACSHAAWFKRYGIDPTSKLLLSDMRSILLRSDEVRKDIDVALRARMGVDWLTEQSREAEHSPAAKLVVEWALRHGYSPGERSLNLAGLVERLTKRILAEPLPIRLELATAFSNTLMHDRANADVQFATTINKYGVT